MATNFREQLEAQSLPWMLRFYGIRFFGAAIGLVTDTIMQAASLALRAAWLKDSTSPDDALPFFGEERQIAQVPGETNAQYRVRLADAWDIWKQAGTTSFAAVTLAPFGVDAASVQIVADRDWVADPGSTHWSRFWIVLAPPLPWELTLWGDAGDQWGDGRTWGSDATEGEVSAVRSQLCKFKSAHEIGVFVVLNFSNQVWGLGSWGDAGKVWGTDVVRWPLGRYWGTKYKFRVWGDVSALDPSKPSVWGGKI